MPQKTAPRQKIGPPNLTYTLTEAVRAGAAFYDLREKWSALTEQAPKGDGRPVLVVPGLIETDYTLTQMRRFLRGQGHFVHGWRGGVNSGPSDKNLKHLEERFLRLSDQHGQKMAGIGHSLGGIFIRELARKHPDRFSSVITLASPFNAGLHPQATSVHIRTVFRIANGWNHRFFHDEDLALLAMTPPPVPTTSIYSPSDGVVNWKACINPQGESTENVEIATSHCGMLFKPEALLVLADRLAQQEKWSPFDASRYPDWNFPTEPAHLTYEPGKPHRNPRPDHPGLFR